MKCSTLAKLIRESGAGTAESIYDLNRMAGGPDNMDSVSVVAGHTGNLQGKQQQFEEVKRGDAESVYSVMTGVS